jgi:hypothetical protein
MENGFAALLFRQTGNRKGLGLFAMQERLIAIGGIIQF